MEETNITQQEKYDKGRHIFKKSIFIFSIIILFFGVFTLGYERGREKEKGGSESALSPKDALIINKEDNDRTIDFSLFWQAWNLLQEKYVDRGNLDAHTLFYGAIKGMLAATGDPYTTFFDPKENQAFQEDISGTFEGIGAEMGMKDNILTIIAPLEGMPAEKAGLMSGDKIIKIEDESTTNLSLEEAVKKIRGPKGTEVKLTIFRVGEDDYLTITVKRDQILVKSVRFEMKDNAIAYIRVNRFGDDTEKEFNMAVKQALSANAKKLIIDVRNNPGGFLETAVSMSSTMLPFGKVVVMEENAKGDRKELKTQGRDFLSHLPTVVLINEGSASASEILAGALKDNRDDVTLIGEKSFGKGSVQELIPLSKTTAMKVTVARWLTPAGHQINTVGITPDIEVEITREDIESKRDPQLDKALEILK
ncbi:MAG: S41 family peptidase [Candidatus Moranbacteria bacterium]|nr:S41 family peptidase [Candidatus Moranbacteria bacterium]OIQ02224.1 MAG: hypothetical protein AUK58_03430 [Candidatus Moranbacteria bacterium CG2_30_41_165]PIP25927.1 MAG: peptidase S41 [Candidatus Moranbacteria bacterium CG23_combo_of_CG06-09_8_20_14_all_41_28]PIV86159.1 MAG: hypothetical protein COW50_03020 [Candidatus Moranbacteria bacterium CG17_big_fil_post_rev_8_21_14_2_50_41_107]PIW94337.1 MAG: hypothetical protein COZ86_01575 [Candidatus Moranbacteria bacterium CG_4_8_14_3_um_filter_